MPQEGMGGQEGTGPAAGRLLGSGVVVVGAASTVTVTTLKRRAGEAIWWSGFPVNDAAGLALGGGSGFSLWLERTLVADEFTLRATNSSGASASVEWWVRGA
jgi:hypothetical protein